MPVPEPFELSQSAIVWLCDPWNCRDVVFVRMLGFAWLRLRLDEEPHPMVDAKALTVGEGELVDFIKLYYRGYQVRHCMLPGADQAFPGGNVPDEGNDNDD